MLRLKLKSVLLAMIWMSVAMAVLADRWRAGRLTGSIAQEGAWRIIEPQVPTVLVLPLVIAAILTLVAPIWIGLILGTLTTGLVIFFLTT